VKRILAAMENLPVSIETHDDGEGFDEDPGLSPAMIRRLKRASAEETAATPDPQYHIMGVIHATIRWMRRRHQVNDLMDHDHATAALPYCNAFFTERDLRGILARGQFHLDQAYGCRVISDPKEAPTYLEKISAEKRTVL
jgi:hypothetical protein